jgi:hypothetical protein
LHSTVVTLDEIAAALNKRQEEMSSLMSSLYGLGFPQPDLGNSYNLAQVLDWLVNQQEMNLALVSMLSAKMG